MHLPVNRSIDEQLSLNFKEKTRHISIISSTLKIVWIFLNVTAFVRNLAKSINWQNLPFLRINPFNHTPTGDRYNSLRFDG